MADRNDYLMQGFEIEDLKFADHSAHTPKTPQPFFKGDLVRLKTGKQPMEVSRCTWSASKKEWRVYADYLSTRLEYRGAVSPRSADQFTFHELDAKRTAQKETEQMAKLFQINEGEHKGKFGTYLATNSEGKLVLEIKGGDGAPVALSKADVEEVKPYTVAININGSLQTFQVPKGSLAVGDIVINSTLAIGRVSQLDTKSDTHKPSNGLRKLVTEKLAEVDDAEGTDE